MVVALFLRPTFFIIFLSQNLTNNNTENNMHTQAKHHEIFALLKEQYKGSWSAYTLTYAVSPYN